MPGKAVAFLDQLEPELVQGFQGLHVVTAKLAGDIAVSAHLALENGVDYRSGDLRSALHKREGGHQPAARGIGMKVVVLNARTTFGKPPAFYEVERNPLAVCATGAPERVGPIILQCHAVTSFKSSL
jgi:hypothetical protein